MKGDTTLRATAADSACVPFLINNLFNYYTNNGAGSFNPFSKNNEGFEFLKGQDKHLVYEDGIVWGGLCGAGKELKVGGSAYKHGIQPGRILTPGTATTPPVADSPTDGHNRVYRVRPDIGPAGDTSIALASIAAEEVPFVGRYQVTSADQILHQYLKDWIEWPAAEGAPFTDIDGDGIYNPYMDVPGEPGAAQTLWYVANDVDSSLTGTFAHSPSIGLEMQRTIWGYTRNMGALTTTIFARTVLINKSGGPIDSMFILQFSDPDIGDGGDDYVGCDTTLNLGFAYNGENVDAIYGVASPAVGYVVLEGPLVQSPGNSGLIDRRRVDGRRNLGMTAFSFFAWGSPIQPIRTAEEDRFTWYNTMNGLTPFGVPFLDPKTSQPTKFCLSGSPVANPGNAITWVDGIAGFSPGDRRIYLSTGPFSMADGDTQEVVVATVGAQGADRIASVGLLKNEAASLLQGVPDLLASAPRRIDHQAPSGFTLYQNYPNPFNPSTTIEYTVAGTRGQGLGVGEVRIVIYDLLGRGVATLVDAWQAPGTYQVSFDGSRLASGVYFCRMTAGSFTEVKAMVLAR